MLKGAQRILRARKKGGQQNAWTPTSQASGVSPNVGLSGFEALNLFYRPLPLRHTVDYEEDFGNSMTLQREFIPKRARDKLAFAVAPLAYSDLELTKAKEQLASQMNRERFSHVTSPEMDNHVPFETNVDPETREVTSARYLFDDKRMAFCERFDQYFGLHHGMFSLMEASAVLYGCDDAGKEAYLKRFLNLDRDSLEEETERIRSLRTDLAEANAMLASNENGDDFDDEEAAEDDGTPNEALKKLPDEFLEYAPLVKSYLSHARGESRTMSSDTSTVAIHGRVAERIRWRQLLLKLAAEDYHTLSLVERADAQVLSDQLHTVKFFDLRLGDAVREIVQMTKRGSTGGSLHSGGSLDRSAAHPENRESDV
jgi:hypothetical protein